MQCLDSTRCLGAITRGEEADVILTGAIEKLAKIWSLLFYDGEMNRVLRRKSFTVASDPSELINAITPILVEDRRLSREGEGRVRHGRRRLRRRPGLCL